MYVHDGFSTHRYHSQKTECRLWPKQEYETKNYRADKCAYARFAGQRYNNYQGEYQYGPEQ